MQDDPRYDDVVVGGEGLPGGAAGVRGRGRASPRSGSGSIPASASARRSSTTSSCCARLDEIVALGPAGGGRAPPASGSSGALTGRPEADRLAGTVAANVLAFERGAHMFRVHDVAATRDALAVAAATVGDAADHGCRE